jgi:uncharacterized RDD family membrane protein YckC
VGDYVTVWIEPLKMVVISSVVWLVLSAISFILAGASERSYMLFVPTPKWPVLAFLLLLWGVSLKLGYWWVFQRYGFYGKQ